MYINKKILEDFIYEVSEELYKIVKDRTLDMNISKEEYDRKNKEKIELQLALKECVYNNVKAKKLVIKAISSIIANKYDLNNVSINKVIDFDKKEDIPSDIKFSILNYVYKKGNNENSLITYLIDKYHLDELKNVDGEERYVITKEEIDKIYEIELYKITLSFEDKINIITQYIYSRYKGFGVIDELLEMDIDGINGGVSGNVFGIDYEEETEYESRSIFIIFRGKNIHLKFLAFENIKELKRVCLNIYKYDNPGELSKSSGFKINKMKDGSRVVVIRPSLGEGWMFFIRKFHVSNMNIESIIKGENAKIVMDFLKFITRGCTNICVSGQQGSGKTTMLLNLIGFLYPVYPIRISESSFELNVRARFPNRNICTIQEIDEVSGQKGLDLLKKTDGLINVIGEVAEDGVASQLIQSCMVAAKSTLFTHHAKTARELVKSLRNSLIKSRAFTDEKIAEDEVISVINFDVHMEKDFYGNRYIERISQIVYIPDDEKKRYKVVDIIRYDKQNSKYMVTSKLSRIMRDRIIRELTNKDQDEFDRFIKEMDKIVDARVKKREEKSI